MSISLRPGCNASSLLSTVLFAGLTVALRLYAASNDGKVTERSLSNNGVNHQLLARTQISGCGASPSWLMVDREHEIIYCLDEAVDGLNGTLTSFRTNLNGSLTEVERLQTIIGPVASALYKLADAPSGRFFAVAHYAGSAVTSYAVDPVSGLFKYLQSFSYNMSRPGPVPSRQDALNPHGVVVDPTGKFVLVPDLGADLVGIYRINATTGHLEEQPPLIVTPGSGPRHAVFWSPKRSGAAHPQNSHFYLVTELDNGVRGYDVSYSSNGTILFSQRYEEKAYGGSNPPSGSKAVEISISPSNDQLVISNRGDATYGPSNDSIATFSLPEQNQNRTILFQGLYPVYGAFPCHFQFSPDGDMLAIALQNSNKVAVSAWNGRERVIGRLLAEVTIGGEVTAVVWGL
ncbi:Lactonase, 7-bladed beta-propeller-domain-containing protein [Aspergillus foveolatus]|uniref:Lactonase, 7-bladed beta-propeller-domain-containing protein n=1 Tax=Aspergillus foveolatus TaxID=210207 RepID=UPI003CCD540C